MGCREAIFVDKSTFDFPIFLPFFNAKFPIFLIFSILSFLFSYFFEQPRRWTPWYNMHKHLPHCYCHSHRGNQDVFWYSFQKNRSLSQNNNFFCSGIVNLLFDGLAYNTGRHFAHCSYFFLPLWPAQKNTTQLAQSAYHWIRYVCIHYCEIGKYWISRWTYHWLVKSS